MPAQGRPTAAPILPAVDDATVPFSALFDTKNGFDPRTVEATAQLAHRSYFRTADGHRFLVESLPSDTDPVADANGTHNPRPTLARAVTTSPTSSPPPTPSSTHARPSAAQTFGTLLRNSLRRRPGSQAIPNPPTSPRTSRAAQSPQQPPPASPVSPMMAAQAAGTHEVTTMMSRLNVNRFSATPLFYNSDGGVQAAEALTDPSYAESPTGGGSPDPPASAVPANQHHHYHIHSPSHDNPVIYGLQPSPDPDTIPPHMAGLSGGHITNFDYVHYTAQANFQVQRQQQQSGATASGAGFPSLMEMSSPIPSPRRDSEFSPLDGPPMHDPEKEFVVSGNGNGYGYGDGSGGGGYYRSPSAAGSAASGLQVPPPWASGPHANYVNIGRSYSSGEAYDTLTPVVVHPATITHAPSHSSDGASTTRDNVMPGEQVLFDG